MSVLFTNRATTLLASSINTSVTSVALSTGTGSKFPSPTGSDWFPVVVVAADGSYEIMRCSSRSGDVLTVARGQEGTTPLSFSAGARVDLRLTAAAINDIINTIEGTTDALQGLVDGLKTPDVLVKTATGLLDAERVVTDTTTIGWDWGTSGQAKANVKFTATARLMGRFTASAGNGEEITLNESLALSVGGELSAVNGAPDIWRLTILTASSTTAQVSFDGVSMRGTTAVWKAFDGLTATLDLGTTGALGLDTGVIAQASWYHVYAIGKPDGTSSLLASLNATTPALPSGYTWKRRLGALRTNAASATLVSTYQVGARTKYLSALLPAIQTGNVGGYNVNSPTWSARAVATFVPPTASIIGLVAHSNSGSSGVAADLIVAPNNGYAGPASTAPPPIYLPSSAHFTAEVWWLLESTNVYIATSSPSSGGPLLLCAGWEDRI